MADEYDAAQERGEVATGDRSKDFGVVNGNAKPATAADLGLRRDEIHEARKIRDAEAANPGLIKRSLDEMVERGEEPTRAAEMRLAEEYDAAQERNEIAGPGNPNFSSGEKLPGWREAGLPPKDLHEARKIRDAEAADPGLDHALDLSGAPRIVVNFAPQFCPFLGPHTVTP